MKSIIPSQQPPGINRLTKSELFSSLPPVWPEDLVTQIRKTVATIKRKVVVLDDDPTGTQTVYDVPVLTTWDVEALSAEFASDTPCFYLLTNTRAHPAEEAVRINQEIGRNLTVAAMKHPHRQDFVVVSRSDSTLRGHFPVEVDALGSALTPGLSAANRPGRDRLPPVLLVPYFEAGGRYTINDVHYVAEGKELVPAAETPFARDAVFGYRSSNLREWVEEKTGGAVRASEVVSISIEDTRLGGPEAVRSKLLSLPGGAVCVANVAAPRDLEVIAWAALRAENAGSRILYRTGASFVAARLGLELRPLWQLNSGNSANGGLTIVGSHVPKTTAQLESLLADSSLERVEISVDQVLMSERRSGVLSRSTAQMNRALAAGRDTVVFTSRKLVTGDNPTASLAIGQRVSDALVELVRGIESRPRYLIAKGGITSSDLATRGLGVKRAMVLGQILPGVPVWELGPETRFHGLPYVVFPGNVGENDSLKELVKKLRQPSQFESS